MGNILMSSQDHRRRQLSGEQRMDSESADLSSQPHSKAPDTESPAPSTKTLDVEPTNPTLSPPHHSTALFSTSGITSWAKNLRIPQSFVTVQEDSKAENSERSGFALFTGNFGLRLSPAIAENTEGTSTTSQNGILDSFTKGIVDSSRSAVKAVQVKARHMVSQNKRRYQEGGFDLDMTYITENIIAMGFPAGDMSSGFLGYVEGFYRNHIEEVIEFFETHHKGKYKVYNLCSERLYNAALLKGKVATFPFDDHNCSPIELIKLFCQSAYSWLKEDIENVVVVHCKAGMGRTGLMISSLLLYLKFFPTAEESIKYFNQKRCVDGKALVLPSQIRYVKYFECILTCFNGENPSGRRCMLRGFRLHKCPYWVRPSITISNHNGVLFTTKKHPKTKDLMPDDFWINAPRKGIVVFALPGEPGLTELVGDFKIYFHDRHGDFYCWLNTTMIKNRTILDGSDLDWFDKRKLPSPGFQVEIVMIDYDGILPVKSKANSATEELNTNSGVAQVSSGEAAPKSTQNKVSENEDKDDVFSDSEGEETGPSKSRQNKAAGPCSTAEQITTITRGTEQLTLRNQNPSTMDELKTDGIPNLDLAGASDIKAIAADASVFSFGDDEDYESD
ncbi:hypothetical protein RJ641_010218 [Dillenia turbinata]|uniref:Phosphatidylinositol-3,4,5-trisphosphate 3-phosphatase n=1 Tax=Dillenia turbinata TaxID=194707 RepID=A0AAN8Z841_9MAGN